MEQKKLGYLSAAPRVSTRPEAEMTGPKTHVLGIIKGFESLGWDVIPFIVGDQVPSNWVNKGSENALKRNKFRILVADLVRLFMGFLNARKAYLKLGKNVQWVYERLAIFQSLGWIFKKHGKLWILETNAPLFIEAKKDRETIILSWLAKYLELRAYRQCDILVCVSDTLKDIIIKHTRISPEKVIVIPNGVDTALFNPEICQPIRFFDDFTIGFVGNFACWQGLDKLIQVVYELRNEGMEINIALVGSGSVKKQLEEKTSQLGLSACVKFVGLVPQNQVPAHIAGFDIGYCGQTQLTESQIYLSPLKVYEYMAMGIPVIASDYEGTRRIINSSNGFLFKLDDKFNFKQTIVKAYQSTTSLPQMGVRCRQEIVKNHSWKARVSSLIDAINARQLQ